MTHALSRVATVRNNTTRPISLIFRNLCNTLANLQRSCGSYAVQVRILSRKRRDESVCFFFYSIPLRPCFWYFKLAREAKREPAVQVRRRLTIYDALPLTPLSST